MNEANQQRCLADKTVGGAAMGINTYGNALQAQQRQTPTISATIDVAADRSFSHALEALRCGRRITRLGWNGKGMWLSLCSRWNGDAQPRSEEFIMRPFIYMRAADGGLVPWLASQSDLLGDDWAVLPD
jgi:hypothetical protein